MSKVRQTSLVRRQDGIALVTVIIIVSIVSLLAFDIAVGQQTWISREQNLKDRSQAEWVRRGAEDYASLILERDARQGTTDNLGEIWAAHFPPFPAENGKVAISIADMQGRFNLNNLLVNGQYNTEYGNIFRRLLLQAEMNPDLVNAVLDWMDKDSRTRVNGAEDEYYMNLEHGYRTANQLFASAQELRLVKGFTADDLKKLEGLVTALPEPTPININTAPAPVLAALFEGMSTDEAKQIVEARKTAPFNSVSDIAKVINSKYKPPKNTVASTSSKYFEVTSFVEFGRYFQQTESLVYRPGSGKPSVFIRHERPLITLAKESENE